MRSTLFNAKYDSRCFEALGLCPSDRDGRGLKWLNQADEFLLKKGLYWGTTGKYNLCVEDNCIVLPPQMACIEKINVQRTPIKLRDVWFQFIENGPGSSPSSFSAQFIGNVCTFKNIDKTGKNITWIVDLVGDVGKQALFLGYDQNGNWIRTDQGGTIKDGILLTGAQSPGTESTILFSSITDIQFPEMVGQSWLYQSDSGTLETLIGHYQYFETRPSYRKFRVPFLRCCSGDSCNTLVEVVAKHEFIPVKVDTDYFAIGNLIALQWMAVAFKKYEEAENVNGVAEAKGFENMAIQFLDSELSHYCGSAVDQVPNITGFSVGSSQPIEILI